MFKTILRDLDLQTIMKKINPNAATIEAYNEGVEDYVKNTDSKISEADSKMLEWIDFALSYIKKNGKILEVGSAIPRDAKYIESKGYQITCSDATPNFIKNLQSQGYDAFLLNILLDSIPSSYDMIYANAVLPHFPEKDLRKIIKNIHEALPSKGIFAFSVKKGNGEEWIGAKLKKKRYTHYWQSHQIKALFQEYGFSIIFENSNDGRRSNDYWLNFVVKK